MLSPPAAAGWQGIGWWKALTADLDREFSDLEFDTVLDCGSAPGHALEALRVGVRLVRLEAPPETLRAVGEMATALGGRVVERDDNGLKPSGFILLPESPL